MRPSHHGIALLIASVGAAFSRNRLGRLGPTFPRALGIPLFPACEQQHRRADGSLRKDFRIREFLWRVNEIAPPGKRGIPDQQGTQAAAQCPSGAFPPARNDRVKSTSGAAIRVSIPMT
ncbi:MAG TPA: hypothetical protein DGA22_12770 [Acidobacterium sp.]|nr:hypothetical protein [Acidobacterium sp.]